jgi:hypothetical protein
VGIGINDPLYLLMSSEMLMQATKYHKSANRNYILCQSQTILTESDSRVKEKVVTIDPYTSENIISKLRPQYTTDW